MNTHELIQWNLYGEKRERAVLVMGAYACLAIKMLYAEHVKFLVHGAQRLGFWYSPSQLYPPNIFIGALNKCLLGGEVWDNLVTEVWKKRRSDF